VEAKSAGDAKAALFISRAGADADFAAVIGEILDAEGYSVILLTTAVRAHLRNLRSRR
jgi:hypothetical protein